MLLTASARRAAGALFALTGLVACAAASDPASQDGSSWPDGWWVVDGGPPPPPAREAGADGAARDAVAPAPDGLAGATFHPRSAWQAADQPVTSSCELDLMGLRYITLHYNGGVADLDGPDDVYDDDDFIALLRAAQSYTLKARSYSLEYNSAVAPDGDEWEVRGLDYCCAANGCEAVNRPSYAIQIPLPNPTAGPTAAQVQGVRRVVARIRAAAAAAGNADHLELNAHRDLSATCGVPATDCPGDAIAALIEDGAFEP